MAKYHDVVYWDSCIIIDCLEKNDKYHYVEPMLKEAESGTLSIVVSATCYAEVLNIRGKSTEVAEALISQFFDQPYVHVYAADTNTMKHAGELRRTVRLETADAIHIATAILRSVPVFLTQDGQIRKRGKKSILDLADKLKSRIRVLTPEEYLHEIGTKSRQSEIDTKLDIESSESDVETNGQS